MSRAHRIRWRHRRDTLPARRHRRRRKRRDTSRSGGTYYPMRVDPEAAQRGVRARLMGAVGAASTTLICIVYAMLASVGSFGATFALAIGVCSFGAAVGLLLSARHEEEVHELAAQFDRSALDDQATGDQILPDDTTKQHALPAPDPLSGIALDERSQLQGVRRADPSAQTDGIL